MSARITWSTTERYILLLCRHGLLFLPVLGFVCVSIAGGFGQDYGVPGLFLDDGDALTSVSGTNFFVRLLGSAVFETQVYATSLLGFTWVVMLLMEDFTQRRAKPIKQRRDLTSSFVPAVAILSLAPLLSAELSLWARAGFKLPGWQTFVLPLFGSLVGLAIFCGLTHFAMRLSRALNVGKIYCILAVAAIVLSLVMFVPITLPAKFLFILLAWLVVAYLFVFLLPTAVRFPALLAIFAIASYTNSVREKYRFPGLEQFYSARRSLTSNRNPVAPTPTERACIPTEGNSAASDSETVDVIESLQHWYGSRMAELSGSSTNDSVGEKKPKLIIVATSGGGYRATFWTALVLQNILNMDVTTGGSIANGIRLITGASGGMVAAAYFVADRTAPTGGLGPTTDLVEEIEADITAAQADGGLGIRNPLLGIRDSLSSVVRQMVLSDIPGVFWPGHLDQDRGRELETHWKRIARSFASLRAGEAAGWRPHIVLSPTLVETGQPLLISNLSLSDIIGEHEEEAVEFFRIFPEAQSSFNLGTAVRMSATFPIILPAVQLPTQPTRRVVDAGYYDNYGVSVAIRFLQQQHVMSWIRRCTSGVRLVQIRAFKTNSATVDAPGNFVDRLIRRFDWVTAPVAGALSARYTTNLYRNNQEIRTVESLYGKPFFDTVIFEPDSEHNVTVTWNLSGVELEQLRSDLLSVANKDAAEKLKQFWQN
jgi:hypothetical protein